jgi:hypothetical protein
MSKILGSPLASTGTSTSFGSPIIPPRPSPVPPRIGFYVGSWVHGIQIQSSNTLMVSQISGLFRSEGASMNYYYVNTRGKFFAPNFNIYFRVQGDTLLVDDSRGITWTLKYTVPSPSPFVPLGLYYDQVDPVALKVLPGGIRSVPLNGGSPSPIVAYIYDTLNKVFKVSGQGSFTISGPILTFTDNSGKNHTMILNTPANS